MVNGRKEKRNRARVIGLTGGVASGKSTVAGMFRKLGAQVIDADVIAHEMLETPDVCAKLRERWGEAFFGPGGRPDRRKIAKRVFADPGKLRELTGWLHPLIRKKMKIDLKKGLQDSSVSFIIVDAPLLLEAHLDAWCDDVLFVDASDSLRAQRTRAHRGWPIEEVQRRESAQVSLSEKRRRANAIIVNSGSQNQTFSQVKRLIQQWSQVFPSVKPRSGRAIKLPAPPSDSTRRAGSQISGGKKNG